MLYTYEGVHTKKKDCWLGLKQVAEIWLMFPTAVHKRGQGKMDPQSQDRGKKP
jgi:hypothetical protein